MTKIRLKTNLEVGLYQIAILGILIKLIFLPTMVVKAALEDVQTTKIENLVESILKPQPEEEINIDIEVQLSRSEKKQIEENHRLAERSKQQKEAAKISQISQQVMLTANQVSSGNAEVDSLIDHYANVYGITEKASRIKKIVWCESKGDPNAKNRYSTAGGLAQYLDSTWSRTAQGQAGLSKYDEQAATEAIVTDVSQGLERKWNASKSCWYRF